MLGLEELLRRYSLIARQEILKDFAKDSCIASTRITLRVFAEYGFKGIAVPCEALVLPAAFMNGERTKETAPVHIGFHNDPKSPGHVVALISKKFLVDASIDQASRPERNILLPPVLYCEAENFLRGGLSGDLQIGRAEPVHLTYLPALNRLTYQKSIDWLARHRWQPATDRILWRLSHDPKPHDA